MERGLGSAGVKDEPFESLRRCRKDATTLDLDRWCCCGRELPIGILGLKEAMLSSD